MRVNIATESCLILRRVHSGYSMDFSKVPKSVQRLRSVRNVVNNRVGCERDIINQRVVRDNLGLYCL